MLYYTGRSMRKYPNAWIFALGMGIAVLPAAFWFVTAVANKTVDGNWEDGLLLGKIILNLTGRRGIPQEPIEGPAREVAKGYKDMVMARPYVYATMSGWAIGPAIMCVALVLMVRRRKNEPALMP